MIVGGYQIFKYPYDARDGSSCYYNELTGEGYPTGVSCSGESSGGSNCETKSFDCTGFIYDTYNDCFNLVFDRGDGVWAGCERNKYNKYRACKYKKVCS